MTRDEFINELNSKGFRCIDTASGKWQAAWFFTRDDKTLVMLVRAGGVDLRLTDLSIEEMINPQGLLSVSMQRSGDLIGEYHFPASGTGIYKRACQIAHWFCQGEVIPADAWIKVGISRKAWGREKPRDKDMRDVYASIGHGNGELP
jgi:hypothetical protein